MAEQEIRALREYAESLEKQNVALNGQCQLLDQQLTLLNRQYRQLADVHTGCHEHLAKLQQEMQSMQHHNLQEQQHLRDELLQLTRKLQAQSRKNMAEVQQMQIQPTPIQASFGGLNSILESRLEHLNTSRADVMAEHVQKVMGFRNFLAGTMNEIHQYREDSRTRIAHLLTFGQEDSTSKKATKDAMIQTDWQHQEADPDIQHLLEVLREQEQKVNRLARQLEEKQTHEYASVTRQEPTKSELIRIEVHDSEQNMQLSTQLRIIDDDSEEEPVQHLTLGAPTKAMSNNLIRQVDNFHVRHGYEEDIDVSQQSTVNYNIVKKLPGAANHPLPVLLKELGEVLQTLQQNRTNSDSQALLRIALLLHSKAEELEHVNLTISHYLHNTQKTIPVEINDRPQKVTQVDDQWRTSLELLSGSRSRQSGHFRDRTSSNHSKFARESTSFDRSQLRICGLPSLLKKPNLTDLSLRISNLKQAHEQRRRRHCTMNKV